MKLSHRSRVSAPSASKRDTRSLFISSSFLPRGLGKTVGLFAAGGMLCTCMPRQVPHPNQGADVEATNSVHSEETRIWPSPFSAKNGFYLQDDELKQEENKGMIAWGTATDAKTEKTADKHDNEAEESHGSGIQVLLKQIPDHQEPATQTCFKARPLSYKDTNPLKESEKCCIKLGTILDLKTKILGINERNNHQKLELTKPITAYNPLCTAAGFENPNVGWIPEDHLLLNQFNSVIANDLSEPTVARKQNTRTLAMQKQVTIKIAPQPEKIPLPQKNDGPLAAPSDYNKDEGYRLAKLLDPQTYGTPAFVTRSPRVSCGGPRSMGKCHACVSQALRKLGKWPPGFMGDAWAEARLFHDSLNSCGRRTIFRRQVGGRCEKKLKALGLRPIHEEFGYNLTGAPPGTIIVWAHGRYGHIEVITKTPASDTNSGRACSDYCSTPGNLRGKRKLLGMYMPSTR